MQKIKTKNPLLLAKLIFIQTSESLWFKNPTLIPSSFPYFIQKCLQPKLVGKVIFQPLIYIDTINHYKIRLYSFENRMIP
jgi:hypothetical protein